MLQLMDNKCIIILAVGVMTDLAYCFYFSFDVDGFYDKSQLKSVEAEYVLQNCMTTSEGYSNLMEAMCRYSETLK